MAAKPIINVNWPTSISKGDTIIIPCTVDKDLTDWKIRCEIFDTCINRIKLATTNSGGSTDEIEVISEEDGTFQIKVTKDLTDNFKKKSFIEIEMENLSGQVFTVYNASFELNNEQITWTDPTD